MTNNINKNINNEKIAKSEVSEEIIDPETIIKYNQLNEKCDKVIWKVKVRKSKIKNVA
jgi:hypothetical protein